MRRREMCSELPFLFARLQHPVEMKELSEAPLTDGTLKTNMSQLEFLTDDELLQVFHKKKTEISIIDDPTMFLNQLRDNDVIPEEQYQKIKKMRKKAHQNDAVYTLLDWLENEQPAKIRRFFESVFEDHIIQQYPKFKVLKYEVLEVQTTVQKDSAIGGKNGFTFDSSAKEDPQPVGVPPPTAQASTSKKRKADKPVYGSPRKNNQKEDPEPIWTYPLYQVELPVTCGNKTGSLHRKKLTKGEDCIFTEGKWYSPGEFEAYGGRSSSKNWKISIRCNNVPLIKLIEAGHLESPPFKKRKVAQHAKGKVPKAPTKNKTSASGNPASEPSTIKVKRKPTGSATQPPQDKDMPSSSSASESESSDIDTDDDDDDEEEDDEGECPIAKLKKFPVTCGSAEGVLHKHRFATGTCGKCIRTEQGWFTPTDFLKLDDTVSDKSWRRSIQFNGKAILYLIEKKILEPHSLICHCRICKSVDVNNLQDNDDECGICSQAGSLVCCDQCPRAFHPECHVPSAEKEAEEVSPREKWCCTFCKFNESRKTLPAFTRPGFTQAVVFNFPVQDHLLKCQYLLIKLYSEDKKRIFGPNPNYTVKDYSEYIEKPMWLDKIKEKLTSCLYDTVEQFVKDIHLIFGNCAKFNKDNKFGKIGQALRSTFDADFKHVFGLQ